MKRVLNSELNVLLEHDAGLWAEFTQLLLGSTGRDHNCIGTEQRILHNAINTYFYPFSLVQPVCVQDMVWGSEA